MNRKTSRDLNEGATTVTVTVATAARFAIALASKGKAPDQVQLLPAGRIETNDGRWFDNDDPDGVVSAFDAGGLQLPFDFEHASEIKAPFGEFAPAAGWITKLENREGAIWASVEWTERGRAAIEAREVRYVSPAFAYAFETGRVLKITSAALTVRPAISALPALTSQQKQESLMDKKALCAALGLPETATDAEILAAVTTAKAKTSAQPSLDTFVPRADYDAVSARATTAEQALASQQSDRLKVEAEAAVDEGVKDGKIAPASKDFYLASCATADGLAKFKAFLSSAPQVVKTTTTGDPAAQPAGQGKALTSEQKQVARTLGLTEEDFLKKIEADMKETA